MGNWRGDKLEIANFRISFLFWFNSCISLTAALTNMKLGREMKLCVPTNIGMLKSMQTIFFLENNNKQPQAIHYKGGMYCACN